MNSKRDIYKNLSNAISKWLGFIISEEVYLLIGIFLLSFLTVTLFSIPYYIKDSCAFIRDILVEAHGYLLDVLVLGILFIYLRKKGERRREIKRYIDEIESFKYWESEEAVVRIIGNIRRLNEYGVCKEIELDSLNLSNKILKDINLKEANLRNINLTGSILDLADFQGANLQNAELSSAKLRGTNLMLAKIKGANLERADLEGADLERADLEGVNFEGANLKNTNLYKAILKGTNFSNVNLSEVKNIQEANLEGSNLTRADLRNLDLKGVILSEAVLQETNLTETDLRQSLNLTQFQLDKAFYTYDYPLLPYNLKPPPQIL